MKTQAYIINEKDKHVVHHIFHEVLYNFLEIYEHMEPYLH